MYRVHVHISCLYFFLIRLCVWLGKFKVNFVLQDDKFDRFEKFAEKVNLVLLLAKISI